MRILSVSLHHTMIKIHRLASPKKDERVPVVIPLVSLQHPSVPEKAYLHSSDKAAWRDTLAAPS